MVASTQRYLAYYIGKKDQNMLNSVWENSIFLHLIVGVIVSILLYLLRNLLIEDILVVDLTYLHSAYFIYYCSIIIVFISIIQAPFNALILAQEKMSFFAILALLDAILKLIIIYVLYFLNDFILEKYSLMYLSSIVFVFLVYVFYCSRKFNKKFSFGKINVTLLKEITVYSSWNIFGNLAFVGKVQGSNILLNIFIGVIANSAYAITNNVTSAIGGLINSIVTAINPQIYKSYAEGDYERNILLINSSSKFSFFLAFIFILPILFNISYLLELWLNKVPLFLVDFIKLALVVLLIDCLSGSLMTGIQATGKVKSYQIFVSISVFLNIPISYFLLNCGYEPIVIYWVALSMALVSLLLRLYFIQKLTQFSNYVYFKSVLIPCFLVCISSIFVTYFLVSFLNPVNSFLSFLIFSTSLVIIVVLNIIVFGLNPSEKSFIFSKISGYLK